jgi:hypothetical protein
VPDDLNRIRNAAFAYGTKQPRSWQWQSDSDDVQWQRTREPGRQTPQLVITSTVDTGRSTWSQRMRCKSNQWYRVEAKVTCVCNATDDNAGTVLWVTPINPSDERGDRIRLADVLTSVGPVTLRSYYKTPPNTKWLEVEIGLDRAGGSVTLHSVYVVENIEPDTCSHSLALPPPPYAYPAPRKVCRITVCDDAGEDRPLTAMLRKRFGRSAVRHVRSTTFRRDPPNSDAVIIASDSPPSDIRSLTALERLATGRVVIVSLHAFARMAGGDLRVRTVEQEDDPINAEVYWADFMTRGFALRDVFPLASTTSDPRIFRQQHIRRSAALNRLRKQRGYEVILRSMTDQDSTSEHPVCLYKPTDGGAVIVFDVAPVETLPTTCDEPNIAAYLLMNMLGVDQTSLGQYAAPVETEQQWIDILKEISTRYPALVLTGKRREELFFELGTPVETLGLPKPRRPLLLIRTGLRGDDMAGIYGTLWYLKQLVRTDPYGNAYVRNLVDRFRLAWIPLCAPWQPIGSYESLPAGNADAVAEFETGAVAAVIDVTDAPRRQLRILYHSEDGDYARQASALPALAADFSAQRYFYRSVENGSPIGRRDELAWRFEKLIPHVAIEPRAFDTDFHCGAAEAGARLIRIEVPGSNVNFICNSIWRTDLAATTLEHVIGLQYGLLAANRLASRVTFDGYPPLRPGEAIDVPAGAPGADLSSTRAG